MYKLTYRIFTLLIILVFISCGQSNQKVVGLWESQSSTEASKVYYNSDGTFKRVDQVKLLGFSLAKIASSGTWVVDNNRLIETVTESQEPFLVATGTISSREIVDAGREFLILKKDGNEITCKHLEDSAIASFETEYQNSMDNSATKRLQQQLVDAQAEQLKLREEEAQAMLLRTTPESTVNVFFTALGKGDYETAKLMATSRTQQVLDQVKSVNEGKEKPFDVKEVNCVTQNEDYAICDLCCDADGNPKTAIDVVREVDGWAVKMESKEQFNKEETNNELQNALNAIEESATDLEAITE